MVKEIQIEFTDKKVTAWSMIKLVKNDCQYRYKRIYERINSPTKRFKSKLRSHANHRKKYLGLDISAIGKKREWLDGLFDSVKQNN